jgi:hypothetical protein
MFNSLTNTPWTGLENLFEIVDAARQNDCSEIAYLSSDHGRSNSPTTVSIKDNAVRID